MSTTAEIPWVPLVSSVAACLVAYVVTTRTVPAVVRAALRELDHRSSDVGTLVTWRP